MVNYLDYIGHKHTDDAVVPVQNNCTYHPDVFQALAGSAGLWGPSIITGSGDVSTGGGATKSTGGKGHSTFWSGFCPGALRQTGLWQRSHCTSAHIQEHGPREGEDCSCFDMFFLNTFFPDLSESCCISLCVHTACSSYLSWDIYAFCKHIHVFRSQESWRMLGQRWSYLKNNWPARGWLFETLRHFCPPIDIRSSKLKWQPAKESRSWRFYVTGLRWLTAKRKQLQFNMIRLLRFNKVSFKKHRILCVCIYKLSAEHAREVSQLRGKVSQLQTEMDVLKRQLTTERFERWVPQLTSHPSLQDKHYSVEWNQYLTEIRVSLSPLCHKRYIYIGFVMWLISYLCIVYFVAP